MKAHLGRNKEPKLTTDRRTSRASDQNTRSENPRAQNFAFM